MSYQLRPMQPQQEPEAQQQQSDYDTYHSSNGYHPQQQQQQYPQYPAEYQWTATGYGPEAAAGQTYHWGQHPPAMTPKSPFSDAYRHSSVTGSSGIPPTLDPQTAPPPKQAPLICGIKRNAFYILLAVTSFVLVLGIATGVGVGLALSDPTPSETSPTPTPTTSTQSTPPAPSFTGTLVSAPVTCPQDNNTVYLFSSPSSPSSAATAPKPFNVECGRDYSSADGAADLGAPREDVATMAECIDLCGARAGCVGVGYGSYEGTWTCWLKSRLGRPNRSPQWYAARLQYADSS